MLDNILMKRGIIHLILVLVVATALSLGIIGLVATQRSQEFESGNVLSSSNQNSGQGQNKKEENKESNSQESSTNTQSQSSNKNESKSQKSNGKTGTTNQTGKSINELEIEDELAARFTLSLVDVRVINSAPVLLRGEVVTHGRLLYARDEDSRIEFETRTRMEYFDFLPAAELYRKTFFENLRQRGLSGQRSKTAEPTR